MGKERKDSERVVRRKEPLIGRDMETGGRKVKVRVQAEHCAPEENSGDMDQEEECQVCARQSLKPGNASDSCGPAANDHPEARCNLEEHAKQKQSLDDGLSIDDAKRAHDRDVGGDAVQC